MMLQHLPDAQPMIRHLLCLLLMGIGLASAAQEQRTIDSLKVLADTTHSDLTRLRTAARLAELSYQNADAAHYLRMADDLVQRLRSDASPEDRRTAIAVEAALWSVRGVIHWDHQRYGEALASYQRCRELATQAGDTGQMLMMHNNMGLILNTMDDPVRAMAEFKTGFQLAERSGNTIMGPVLLGRMGDTHLRMGDTAKAEALLLAAVRNAHDPSWSVPHRLKLAEIRIGQHRLQEARAQVETVLPLAEKDVVDGAYWISNALLLQARIDTAMGRRSNALQHLDRCIERPDTQANVWYSRCLELRADLHLSAGDKVSAEHDLRKILTLASGRDLLIERAGAAKRLKALYAGQGRTTDELRVTDEWMALNDSLHAIDAHKALMAVEFRAAQRADSIAHAEERNTTVLRHAADMARERNRRILLLIGIAALLLFAFATWWRMRYVARANKRILEAQARTVEAEKQRENEQVRTRIARDIHDEIGSGLTKIAMLGSEARQRVQEHSEELRTTLDRITAHSRAVNAALSDIVWSVDPAHDTSEELVHHARNVAQRLLEGSGVQHVLQFDHTDPVHPVSPGVKHHIVMVMKEAINNALKYADAKHINVHLEAGAHRVKLVVADDGKGFDPEASARTGNGLRNMQARAKAIGARLVMRSAPGHGCTLEFDGPLA